MLPIVWQYVKAVFRMTATAWMFINDLPWREMFGLVLEIIDMVLWPWIFWVVAWIAISVLQSMLQWSLIIGWQYVSRLWMLVYTCLWKFVEPFVTVLKFAWDYMSSMATSLHQQGSYTVKGSRINYGPIFGHLWKTHAPLVVVLVVAATCLLIWRNQQNRSRRILRSAESGKREIQQQKDSRSQSASHDIPVDGDNITNSTNIEAAASILSPCAPKKDNTLQESTYSDIELRRLRKQLYQAKTELSRERGKVSHVELLKKKLEEELSQERDKVLCVELLQRQLQEANEELSQEQDKYLCIVCQDLKREMILKPCNHYCLCPKCSKALKQCPICKKKNTKG